MGQCAISDCRADADGGKLSVNFRGTVADFEVCAGHMAEIRAANGASFSFKTDPELTMRLTPEHDPREVDAQ